MAGTTRTFHYTLTAVDGEDHKRLVAKARKTLGWACDGDKRITCHDVAGDAVGVVQLSMTIVGRDRWRSKQLAWDIINMVTWGLNRPATLELLTEKPAPHTHRGYAYGRTKTWRERS